MRIMMFLAFACAGSAAPEFVGVMASGKETLFAVRENESASATWLSIGAKIGEFAVVAYDAKAELLTLKKGDERISLRLPESRVLTSRDEVVVGLLKKPD